MIGRYVLLNSVPVLLFNLIFISGTITCLATHASAPSRMPPANATEAFKQADVVFLGEVLATRKDKLGYDSLATVKVQRIWKGKPLLNDKCVEISGEGGPTYPARLFKPKEHLLFYLGRDLHADSFINRVVQEQQATKEIKALDSASRQQHPCIK